MTVTGKAPSRLRDIPRGIWALGFVSMLMDVSSEMIHALLPIYLVTVLGTSALTVGFIEGLAEATALITKIFSGALSDWLGKRKALAAIGYGLAAFTKPIFPLASTVGWLVAARFIDRIGKGIRGAPRDALVADLSPDHLRGASFGLRQSLDTVGAFAGPLLAIGLMWLTLNYFTGRDQTSIAEGFLAGRDQTSIAEGFLAGRDQTSIAEGFLAGRDQTSIAAGFTVVFWVAVIPAFLSLALILFAVREPNRPAALRKVRNPISRAELRQLGPAFWRVAGIAAVFTLARFSEAFLILKAQAAGLPIVLVPGVFVVMNAVYALAAYPAGALSDRMSRRTILIAGIGLLIVADLVLAMTQGIAGVALGVMIWGLHMGLTQGLLSALVADTAPPELRGTAFGVFNLACGVAALLASLIAGLLWDTVGPQGTFLGGAVFATLALAGLLAIRADRLTTPVARG